MYHNGGDFEEGLAPVRLNGTYGYINTNGQFVIEPQFDRAYEFSGGEAKVYFGSKPYIINKKGEKLFEHNGVDISGFAGSNYAFLKTKSGKVGLINKQGTLFIDTIYSDITPTKENVLLVNRDKNIEGFEDLKLIEYGLIDTSGKTLIPFGVYRRLEYDGNNYFRATYINDSNEQDMRKYTFIDEHENVIFSKTFSGDTSIMTFINNGMLRASVAKHDSARVYPTDYHVGYYDMDGKLAIKDTNYVSATDFYNNRAFVQLRNNNWYNLWIMIDKKGNQIGDMFYSVNDRTTIQGMYVVSVGSHNNYGIMDTNGNYIIKPQFRRIYYIENYGDYFFFTEKETDDGRQTFGIGKLNGEIIRRDLDDYDYYGFVNGLLRCRIGKMLCYIDTNGKEVWREQADKIIITRALNIDYMNRGYFYATSENRSNHKGYGGWGGSDNNSRNIKRRRYFEDKRLQVFIDTTKKKNWAGKYIGYELMVANTTDSTCCFNAQDSRLYLNLQAMDEKGEWRDIEYLPSSWCGNSYHSICLDKDEMWTFTIPKYHGSIQTKLRARLEYIGKDNEGEKTEETVYSNVINTNINPGQFWYKEGYSPSGLMDPYND